MKLSDYARKEGITAKRRSVGGNTVQITGFQQPSGTIMVTEEAEPPVLPQGVSPVVIYARVFVAKHLADLNRQAWRLKDDGATRGTQVGRMVTEMGSGVNDSRRTLLALLSDPPIDPIVVAHQERAMWFGFRY